jgi:RNA polymerase sigma-32 factor
MTDQETNDLAQKLDVPVASVRDMEVRMTSSDVAFDGAGSDDEEFTTSPAGYLPDMRYNPEQLVMRAETSAANKSSLVAAIDTLDERSRNILQRRWLNEDKATLHELASEYSVSAERIRQIEKRAMEKMKSRMTI